MMAVIAPLVAAAALALASGPATQGELTVSAAGSLTDVLEALAPVFAERTGVRVRFNFGASNVLARQIVRGAPVDVFISADAAQMDVVSAAGALVPDSRVDLLSNRLVIVTLAKRSGSLRNVRDLLAADVRRIAIGDPAAVPAGVYARKYLEAVGLWRMVEPKIVPVASVRAVVAAVQHGAVDAGFSYESDTAVSAGLRVALVVPADEGPRIVYPAAVISRSSRRGDARRFVEFLRSAEAAEIFLRFKFIPLAEGR